MDKKKIIIGLVVVVAIAVGVKFYLRSRRAAAATQPTGTQPTGNAPASTAGSGRTTRTNVTAGSSVSNMSYKQQVEKFIAEGRRYDIPCDVWKGYIQTLDKKYIRFANNQVYYFDFAKRKDVSALRPSRLMGVTDAQAWDLSIAINPAFTPQEFAVLSRC